MENFKFDQIKNLLPMPMSAVRLAALVADMDSSVGDFQKVIELDQALTAHVLKWANSSWSRPSEPISNIRDAIVRLGTANILKLTMGQNFIASMSHVNPMQNQAENALWYHGVASAYASENLIQLIAKPVSSMVFTASLMHDVGKLLIGRHVGFEMLESALLKLVEEQDMDYLEAERKLLGTDHVEVGVAFAQHWKFPEVLIEGIANHHQTRPDKDMLINTVILANAIGKLVHPGINSTIGDLSSINRIISKMGLDQDIIYSLVVKVKEGMLEATGLWYDNQPDHKQDVN